MELDHLGLRAPFTHARICAGAKLTSPTLRLQTGVTRRPVRKKICMSIVGHHGLHRGDSMASAAGAKMSTLHLSERGITCWVASMVAGVAMGVKRPGLERIPSARSAKLEAEQRPIRAA